MHANDKINLLSGIEIDSIYALPLFNEVERSIYFEFTDQELEAIKKYRTDRAQVSFMLSLGYFKAKQQLYRVDLSLSQDTQYLVGKYFDNTDVDLAGKINDRTYQKQKADILTLFNYQDWSPELELKIDLRACELLRYYPKPHNASRQLLDYFDKQQIIIPGYRKLQDIFTCAFTDEEKRLNKLILAIPDSIKKQLSSLIARDNGITQLNIIRSDQKDFQYTAVRDEVKKAQTIAELYEFSKLFIPSLRLSKNAVYYYAEVTEQYAAFRLRKLSKPQQWLYALCFIYHRYQQIMDNLIISFMSHVKAIMDAGKTFSDIALMEHSSGLVVDFPKLASFLKWFPERNETLTHEELNEEAYNILPKIQFPALAKFFDSNTFDKKAARWKFYLKSARLFSLYLRPIVIAVSFMFYKENDQIIDLITLLKTHYGSGKTPASFKLADEFGLTVPWNMTQYLKKDPNDKYLDPHLFEFFVYQKIYHHIDRGRLCCNDSLSYCDIDCDLVSEVLVDNAEKIATEFGYPKIPIYCDKHLDDATKMLDEVWETTTKNINTNNNAGFNLKTNKTGQQEWSLLYDSSEKLDDSFFKSLPKVEIADVVMFIGDLISMWDSFTHIKGRYIKRTKPTPLAVNACILSEAFGFGEMKMAEMSDLDFNSLRSTREDFIRIDTICTANDGTCDYIKSLPIFKLWNLLDDKLLADADGQRIAASNQTIQSRYSKKYFGKGKGISLYTLIANSVAVNAKNIGPNEYEGHSLYDMIYNNKTDIDIDMVTGDNHSLNKLNFIALDSIDVEYVPSIKNIREATNDLYSIQSINNYTGPIQPKAKINTDLIRSQKRGILRVLLSLIMQENTQSNIIRKLNSHARYARLKAALFEYNKILKSTHVLNLIDDMSLRKAIRTARNRTEAYHQLQGLIRKIYNGVFKGRKIVDNRVGAHAARLTANCIITYCSIILNEVYVKMLRENVSQEIIKEFARISPIAWTHILFTGRYSFKKSTGDINIATMAQEIEKHLKQYFWKAPDAS